MDFVEQFTNIILHIHNQFSYLDTEDQLEFLVIKILGGDSKPIFW